jgi:Dullard-like phosphatase family protein
MLETVRRSPLSGPNLIPCPLVEPKSAPRVSIVLDLDNTLICASVTEPETYDFAFDFIDFGRPVQIYVRLRPFLQQFLDELRAFADLYLFTSGTSSYTQRILSSIDPSGVTFRGVFAREDCRPLGSDRFAKDYEKCGTNMERTLIVDDNPNYFGKWRKNGLAIRPFVGQSGDMEFFRVLYAIRSRCTAMGMFCS